MLKRFFDVMALRRKINTMQNEIDTIKEEKEKEDAILKRTRTMLKKEREKKNVKKKSKRRPIP